MTGGVDDLRARLAAGIDALDRVEAFTADLRGMGFDVRVTHDGALPSVTVHVAIGMDAVPDGVRVEGVIARPKIVVPEPKPAATPTTKTMRVGPWSDAELAELARLHTSGSTVAEISAALSRAPQAVGSHVRRLEDQRKVDAGCAPPPPQPAPAPPAPVRERPDGWTAQDDLVLVEGLSQGRKLPTIAAELRRGPEACKERFRKLLPNPTLDTQSKLIRALRAEVAA